MGEGERARGGRAGGLRALLSRYREALTYLVFAQLGTVVSVVVFAASERGLGWPTLVANVLAWVLSTLFMYVTFRRWVFAEVAHGVRGIAAELCAFAGSRLAVLGLEEVVLWVGVDVLGIDSLLVKVVALVVLGILNYFVSKLLVFRAR